MYQIIGKHNKAAVYAESIDNETYSQIMRMCNEERLKDCNIAMMPDTHASAGCTVGTSIMFHGMINPSYVGDDIGCGMQVYKLKEREIDFQRLDDTIREFIPSGPRIHGYSNINSKKVHIKELHCYDSLRLDTVKRSFGTLGGGNHFVEVERSADGSLYLVIHSGSRRLGRDVAMYHQKVAFFSECGYTMDEVKKKGLKAREIKTHIQLGSSMLSGGLLDEYLSDMDIAVTYASESRKWMGDTLIERMGFSVERSFTTIHNYIDSKSKILRKGAVAANEGEILIIPINMKDGSLLCRGKGNAEWNFTAPHGAGRVLKRSEAREQILLEDFQEEMKGIFSTSVNQSTIDESPMAYRRIDEIYNAVEPTAEVLEVLKPVYNFKASKPTDAEADIDDETSDGED